MRTGAPVSRCLVPAHVGANVSDGQRHVAGAGEDGLKC